MNFATTRAIVHYDLQQTDPQKLREAVKAAGYDAILVNENQAGNPSKANGADAETQAREKEYKRQKHKFIIALALTIPVAVLAMGSHISAFQSLLNFPGRIWVELVLTTPILFWAGREFFSGAWGAAKHRATDTNTLIAIGTFSAYAYSVGATVADLPPKKYLISNVRI